MSLKKIILLTLLFYISVSPVFARSEHSFIRSYLGFCTCPRCTYDYTHVYLVDVYHSTKKSHFDNCEDHYLLEEITTEYYSDKTQKSYSSLSILDRYGNVLEKNLNSVEHIIYENKHYFILEKFMQYGIYNDKGKLISTRKYKYMQTIIPNRLLAKYNKSYGVIDLKENNIVPFKYKSIKKADGNLLIAKLNGYWGVIDSENNTIINHEYNKIKKINNSYVLKKEGKFGLANINAQILYDAQYDKIKRLGEYILIKKDKSYGILDANGKALSEIKYKKVRLKRGILEIKIDKEWEIFQE